MNKKAFTMVELLVVIVIISIIAVITVPNIMESLAESRRSGGESVENIVLENLRIYNTDNEEDLWCLEDSEFCDNAIYTCARISIEDLYELNPDIDLGECLFKDENSLYIQKNDDGKYKYYAEIVCGKNLKDGNDILDSDKIIDEGTYVDEDFYYISEEVGEMLEDECLFKDEEKGYTVKYDANGGTGEMGDSAHYYGRFSALSKNTFTKTGYSFLGWSKDQSATTPTYQDEEMVSDLTKVKDSQVTLYAIWGIKNNKVTYDYSTNGGNSSNKTSEYVTYGNYIDVNVNNVYASKEGWNFVGWNTNKNATTALTELKMGDEPVTLYAIYEKEVEGTYYYYDGSKQVSVIEKCTMYNNATTCNFKLPNEVSLSSGPNATEYKGVSSTIGSTEIVDNYTSDKVKYYAVYEKQITSKIYYNSNTTSGGLTVSTATASGIRTATTNGTAYSVKESNITIPDIVKESIGKYNGDYVGVSSNANTVTTSSNITTENQTYYAIYSKEVKIYYPKSTSVAGSVTFYRNEYFVNSGSMNAVISTANNTETTITVSNITGLYGTLNGFTSSVNVTAVEYTNIEKLQNSGAIKVYAVTSNDITISYNANGGSGAPSTQTTTRTTYCVSETGAKTTGNTTISETIPKREGYTFLGWYENTVTNYDTSTTYKTHPLYYYADTYSDLYDAFGYNEDSLFNHYYTYVLKGSENRTVAPYESSKSYNIATSKTLYAGWYQHKQTISIVIKYDTSKFSGPSSTYSSSTYQSLSKSSVTINYSASETITASPAYPDDRYTGNVSCSSGISATLTEGSGTTSRTDSIKITNNLDKLPQEGGSLSCTITYTPKWEGIPYGSYTAGNTITYAGEEWTITKDNGVNTSLALNSYTGSGAYKTNVQSNLGNSSVNADILGGGLVAQSSGIYVTTDSGTSLNPIGVNYWANSEQIYNNRERTYYEVVKKKFLYGQSNMRGSDGSVGVVNVNNTTTSTGTLSTGVKTIANNKTKFTISNGEITFPDASKSCESGATSNYLALRMVRHIFGYSCSPSDSDMCYRTSYYNYDDGTYTLSDVSWDNPKDLEYVATAHHYVCGGDNHGKRTVYSYQSASYFKYGNQATGTGWVASDGWSRDNAVSYSYKNDDGEYWYGRYAGWAVTCNDEEDSDCVYTTISGLNRTVRRYRFNTYSDNGYCYKRQVCSTDDVTYPLYYRPFIKVRER